MTAQAPRLDIITENSAENVRRVQARDLAASVVQANFRLAKQSTLHSLENQAVVRQVEDTAHIINDYGDRTDQNVSILFAYNSIFVGGQLLKAYFDSNWHGGLGVMFDDLLAAGYTLLCLALVKSVLP